MTAMSDNELQECVNLMKVHVDGLFHLAKHVPIQYKALVKDYLTTSWQEIVKTLDASGHAGQARVNTKAGVADETSDVCDDKSAAINTESNSSTKDNSARYVYDVKKDSNHTSVNNDHQNMETAVAVSSICTHEDKSEQDKREMLSDNFNDDIENNGTHNSKLNLKPAGTLQDTCDDFEATAVVDTGTRDDTEELAAEMGTVQTQVQDPHGHNLSEDDYTEISDEGNLPEQMDCEDKDSLNNQCDTIETTPLHQSDGDLKEGQPEDEEAGEMSTLLSFLPELSPYIKLDSQDGSAMGVGDRDGFIHLTVERADGSVQNLRIGTVLGKDEGKMNHTQPADEANTEDGNDASHEQVEEKLPEKENDHRNSDTLTSPRQRRVRPRGRPKKAQTFHPVLTEDNELVYTCPYCPDLVKSENALKVHLRKHTGEKPFSCQICGKSFTTKGNMQQHEKTRHSDVKPWSCRHCGKAFKEKKVMTVHERVHTGERPYKCHLCPKSFSQAGVLKEHLLVHSGQKPHLCDLCGQEFRGVSALKAHKLRHLNKRDFKCNQCSKDFVSKNDLKRHAQSHSGIKPFLCSICPKSFSRLHYLKEHVNLHRGLKPYTCLECGASFAESTALHRHKIKKHRNERESKQSELEKELTSGSIDLPAQTQGYQGQTSVQLVFDENTSSEDFQRLHSLVLSTANNVDYSLNAQDQVKQIYQVLCVNPDTQEISSIPGVEGQSSTDFSAINLLASATAQQYTLQ